MEFLPNKYGVWDILRFPRQISIQPALALFLSALDCSPSHAGRVSFPRRQDNAPPALSRKRWSPSILWSRAPTLRNLPEILSRLCHRRDSIYGLLTALFYYSLQLHLPCKLPIPHGSSCMQRDISLVADGPRCRTSPSLVWEMFLGNVPLGCCPD